MVQDLCGRLYGEVEEILLNLGQKIHTKYSKYAYSKHAGVENNLLNLETTLLGISVICSEKKKDSYGYNKTASEKSDRPIMADPDTEHIRLLYEAALKIQIAKPTVFEYLIFTLQCL